MIKNFKLPEDFMKTERTWLDDLVDALDPEKNGFNKALDPDRNGFNDAFKPPPKDKDKDKDKDGMSTTTLLLLGAGGLVLAYTLMK